MSVLGGCVIGSQLGHILIGQADGNAAHGRMATVAAAIGLQRLDQIFLRLAIDLRHAIHLGVGGAVVLDAVAAHAHRQLARLVTRRIGCRIACSRCLRLGAHDGRKGER